MKTLISLAGVSTLLAVCAFSQAEAQGRDRGQGAQRALAMLHAADLNGDNIVTRAEVRALDEDEFAFRDRNNDGYLDEADASPARQRLRETREEMDIEATGRRMNRRGARLEKLDANDDGRISREEYLGRERAVFDRLDANGDDRITPAELDEAVETFRERRQERREARRWWRG